MGTLRIVLDERTEWSFKDPVAEAVAYRIPALSKGDGYMPFAILKIEQVLPGCRRALKITGDVFLGEMVTALSEESGSGWVTLYFDTLR